MKHILITGATGGIGKSIAKLLAKEDTFLYLQYHSNEEAKKELETLPGKKKFFKVDLSKAEEILPFCNALEKEKIDIFIHSPGAGIVNTEFVKKEWGEFEKHLTVQVQSFFTIVKMILPSMKEEKKGRIVAIATEYTQGRPPERLSDYVTAKYALVGLCKSLAGEIGKFGITVNCVSPGILETNLTKDIPRKFFEIVANQTPLKRIAAAEDVAQLVLFFCSEKAGFITGENVLVDGGYVMR